MSQLVKTALQFLHSNVSAWNLEKFDTREYLRQIADGMAIPAEKAETLQEIADLTDAQLQPGFRDTEEAANAV